MVLVSAQVSTFVIGFLPWKLMVFVSAQVPTAVLTRALLSTANRERSVFRLSIVGGNVLG